jgi:hypothetical protein
LLIRHDSALGVEHLLRITGSPTLSAYDRYRCAVALATAGAVDEARELFRQVLRDPTADELDLCWAAEDLSELGFRREAVTALTEAALGPYRTAKFRLDVIEQLRELGALGTELAPVLIAVRDAPAANTRQRINAVTLLGAVNGSTELVPGLLRLAGLPGSPTPGVGWARRCRWCA